MEELKVNKLKQIRKVKTDKLKKEKVKKKTKYTGLYFVLPSLIGVAVFTLLPFLDVILRSFQSTRLQSQKRRNRISNKWIPIMVSIS